MEIGDALRGYLALASGLTEVTRERAKAAAQTLAAQGEQASSVAEDLWRTSRANRTAMVELIRQESERMLRRAGLASAERLREVEGRLRAVERQLAARSTTSGRGSATQPPAAKKSPAKKAAGSARKAAKKTAARKSSS